MADDRTGATVGAPAHPVRVTPGAPPAGPDRERLTSLRGLVLIGAAVLLGALVLPAASAPPPTGSATASTGSAGAATASTPAPTTPSPASSSGAPASHPSGTGSGGTASSGTGTSGPAPATVHVLVANGSSVDGLATSVGNGLHAHGYAVVGAVSALTTVGSSQVYPLDATGTAATTALLALLGLDTGDVVTPEGGPPPVSSTAGADIVVVAGPDLAKAFPASSAGG